MTVRPRPLIRFVYVIGPQQGLQKVGIATDPQTRLAALQTGNAQALMVHAALPVPFRMAHAIERVVHTRLATSRVRNEWFDTTPAEAIVAVHDAVAPLLGQTTPSPDPNVIWPAVAKWRLEPGRGLPLFDYAQEHVQPLNSQAVRSGGWWERLKRTMAKGEGHQRKG